jgi:hypothetical protein
MDALHLRWMVREKVVAGVILVLKQVVEALAASVAVVLGVN